MCGRKLIAKVSVTNNLRQRKIVRGKQRDARDEIKIILNDFINGKTGNATTRQLL